MVGAEKLHLNDSPTVNGLVAVVCVLTKKIPPIGGMFKIMRKYDEIWGIGNQMEPDCFGMFWGLGMHLCTQSGSFQVCL